MHLLILYQICVPFKIYIYFSHKAIPEQRVAHSLSSASYVQRLRDLSRLKVSWNVFRVHNLHSAMQTPVSWLSSIEKCVSVWCATCIMYILHSTQGWVNFDKCWQSTAWQVTMHLHNTRWHNGIYNSTITYKTD